jgi:hypothetical protein
VSNARKPRKAATPAPPAPADLPRVPSPDELTFDDMWLIKAATGVDVLDPPVRGLAIAACLWFVSQRTDNPLTWEAAKLYRLDDVEIGGSDLDEGLERDDDGDPTDEAEADPTRGSETPSSVS